MLPLTDETLARGKSLSNRNHASIVSDQTVPLLSSERHLWLFSSHSKCLSPSVTGTFGAGGRRALGLRCGAVFVALCTKPVLAEPLLFARGTTAEYISHVCGGRSGNANGELSSSQGFCAMLSSLQGLRLCMIWPGKVAPTAIVCDDRSEGSSHGSSSLSLSSSFVDRPISSSLPVSGCSRMASWIGATATSSNGAVDVRLCKSGILGRMVPSVSEVLLEAFWPKTLLMEQMAICPSEVIGSAEAARAFPSAATRQRASLTDWAMKRLTTLTWPGKI